MTLYRFRSSTPTGSANGSERASDWDALGGEASVDVVGEAAELIARLSSLLQREGAYDGLGVEELRTHQGDLTRLSRLGVAATARAGKAYARAGGLAADGTPSLQTHYRPGRSNREAGELAALANATESVPATIDALAVGDLSPAAASVIARAVNEGRLGPDDAEVEKELLAVGRGQTSDVISRHVKREEHKRDGDSLRKDEERQHHMRRMSLTERRDGMWSLSGMLPSGLGEKTKVLFEALTTRDPERPDRPVPPDHHVWAELPTGKMDWTSRPLSPQAVRQLCCDASLTRILTKGESQILDVGRATPTWSGPQRTAIRLRDRQCRGPNCSRPIGWTEIHHIRWYRNKGETNLDNGVSLCRACHDLVHHSGWHPTQPWTRPTQPSRGKDPAVSPS